MENIMMRTIIAVEPKMDYHIQLTYSDGEQIVVNFQQYIERGGVFALLNDP